MLVVGLLPAPIATQGPGSGSADACGAHPTLHAHPGDSRTAATRRAVCGALATWGQKLCGAGAPPGRRGWTSQQAARLHASAYVARHWTASGAAVGRPPTRSAAGGRGQGNCEWAGRRVLRGRGGRVGGALPGHTARRRGRGRRSRQRGRRARRRRPRRRRGRRGRHLVRRRPLEVAGVAWAPVCGLGCQLQRWGRGASAAAHVMPDPCLLRHHQAACAITQGRAGALAACCRPPKEAGRAAEDRACAAGMVDKAACAQTHIVAHYTGDAQASAPRSVAAPAQAEARQALRLRQPAVGGDGGLPGRRRDVAH